MENWFFRNLHIVPYRVASLSAIAKGLLCIYVLSLINFTINIQQIITLEEEDARDPAWPQLMAQYPADVAFSDRTGDV